MPFCSHLCFIYHPLKVVNGDLFRLDLEVGPSECFNTIMNIGKTAAACPLLSTKLVSTGIEYPSLKHLKLFIYFFLFIS